MNEAELIAKAREIAAVFERKANDTDSEVHLRTFSLIQTKEALAVYFENPMKQRIEVFVDPNTGKMLTACYKPAKRILPKD